jgi:hypothetical protein
LVGEVAVRVVQPVAAAADVQPGVLDVGPGVAGAHAYVRHEAVRPDAEARQVEVEQGVAHHAVVPDVAAAAHPAGGAGDAVDLALAVVALDLRADAVAEAPAERTEAHEADVVVVDAEAACRGVVEQVDARTGADIGAGHGCAATASGQENSRPAATARLGFIGCLQSAAANRASSHALAVEEELRGGRRP